MGASDASETYVQARPLTAASHTCISARLCAVSVAWKCCSSLLRKQNAAVAAGWWSWWLLRCITE
eukprot:362204-Chlamydomonas_euryale.AAC.1